MLTNEKCTLLQGGTLTVLDCWWEDTAAINVQKFGYQNAATVRVFIPITSTEPKLKSHLIKGTYTASTDVGAFLLAGGKAIMSVDKRNFGSLQNQHYEVTLK